MDIIVVASCLACISFCALTMYKVSLIKKVSSANDNLESIVITKATDAISSVYKENKKLQTEIRSLNCKIKELDIEKAVLTEKLEKITKQIDSFNRVFK